MPALRSLVTKLKGADRRTLLVATAGVAVFGALATLGVVLLLPDTPKEPPPPAKPLVLVTGPLDDIYSLGGHPAELAPESLEAIVGAVRGYLDAATVAPLEWDPDDEEAAPPPDLAGFFSEPAAARLDGDDRLALADHHLPHARWGVSTERAQLDLAALVDDAGVGLLVTASVDVEMLVRIDDDETEWVIVHRTGEFVLEPVEGAWRIASYAVRVERDFRGEVTTEEAAFG